MVHGKGDTNHGAANPPSSEERARRNPTARITGLLLPRHYPPGSTRETSPAASKSLDTSSGAGHLLWLPHQPGKGPGSSEPSPAQPSHTSAPPELGTWSRAGSQHGSLGLGHTSKD